MGRLMGGLMAATAVAVVAGSGAAGPASAEPARAAPAASCDRACLDGYVDKYLAALYGHDPKLAPLAADVKFTENGQRLAIGDGLWGTVDGPGGYKLYIDDPQDGQVGYYGTVKESGRLAILSLRLKIVGGKITQVETLVVRKEGAGHDFARPQDLKTHAIFNQPLAANDHPSRAELVRIANAYFEGLEHATDKLTPFDPNCQRIENGAITANNPSSPSAMSRMSCGQQFATHFSSFITQVRGRRYPVVDLKRGLVLAYVSFDHAGKIKKVKLADGTTMTVPAPFDAPYSFLMSELFKIVGGKINRVEAVIETTPYKMPSGWTQ